jgi:hypothetical protein
MTTNGHSGMNQGATHPEPERGLNDIAGSSHRINQRLLASTAYDLGWNHARSMLLAQFTATLENARRMAQIGPEREFHAGLAAGLERAITRLDDIEPALPAEREIFVVGLEDGEDYSSIVACSTNELALSWVRFLNTLSRPNDADAVIGKVRLDAPVPALDRTEQIYTAIIKPARLPDRPDDLVTIHEVDQIWRGDSLWLGVREVGGSYHVTGLFAETKEAAREQALATVRAWLAQRGPQETSE